MAKHGICPKKKRQYGKGRKNKPTVITKRFIGKWYVAEDEWSYPVGHYRTWNQSSRDGLSAPSRKRWKGNRRRARKNVRASAVSVQRDVKAEKDAKHAALEKKKKFHAKQTRQMRKRFLRDIHELWEKQRLELRTLKEDSI